MKNTLHSKLDKEYREVKRMIGVYTRRIEIEKRRYWDMWEKCSMEVFEAVKRQTIKDYKEILKDYHKRAKELKNLIYLSQKEFNVIKINIKNLDLWE